MSLDIPSSVGLEPVALGMSGALASRELGHLFWASAAAVLVTAFLAMLSRSIRSI